MHLADAEIMGAARFRTALAEPGARFAVYDQDERASGLEYSHAGPANIDGGCSRPFERPRERFILLCRPRAGYARVIIRRGDR